MKRFCTSRLIISKAALRCKPGRTTKSARTCRPGAERPEAGPGNGRLLVRALQDGQCGAGAQAAGARLDHVQGLPPAVHAAGGTTDLLARALTTQLSDDLGVNVIVQNVEGGGGTTGTSQAVNSKADGYTLAICSNGGYLINPAINEVGYTWETTTPICIVSEIPIALGVAASSPYETLQDLIDAAAAAPAL